MFVIILNSEQLKVIFTYPVLRRLSKLILNLFKLLKLTSYLLVLNNVIKNMLWCNLFDILFRQLKFFNGILFEYLIRIKLNRLNHWGKIETFFEWCWYCTCVFAKEWSSWLVKHLEFLIRVYVLIFKVFEVYVEFRWIKSFLTQIVDLHKFCLRLIWWIH